jgi:hypothetical protein
MKKILTNPEWLQNNPTSVHMLRRRYGTLTPLRERLLSFGGVFALACFMHERCRDGLLGTTLRRWC